MVTLRTAMSLKKEELEEIKKDIAQNVKDNIELNAYINIPEIKKDDTGLVPILIKDNISVKNESLTCSSKILKGYISPYNASVINKLRENQICAFGRANMDEFGMGSTTENSCYGRTKNPIDGTRVPGGSSGGSAAAVSAKLAIASLGSDTGGSIRQPASYCGVVGLKPSYGRVSRYGLVAYSSSLEQIGPITQNVEDASLLLDIISGSCDKDSTCVNLKPTSTFNKLDSNKSFTVAIISDFIENATLGVKNAYYQTIKTLENMGHRIVEKKLLNLNYQIYAYYIIAMAEASANLSRFDGIRYGARVDNDKGLSDIYYDTRDLFGDEVKKRIMMGSFVLSSGYYDAYYLKAQKVRALIKRQYDDIFNDCDIILSPVAPSVAPQFGELKSSLDMYLNDIYTIGVNLSGLPSISLPVVLDPLPIGMQFIGKYLGEQSILDLAYALERELSL